MDFPDFLLSLVPIAFASSVLMSFSIDDNATEVGELIHKVKISTI